MLPARQDHRTRQDQKAKTLTPLFRNSHPASSQWQNAVWRRRQAISSCWLVERRIVCRRSGMRLAKMGLWSLVLRRRLEVRELMDWDVFVWLVFTVRLSRARYMSAWNRYPISIVFLV
jgi:hypothetical protein